MTTNEKLLRMDEERLTADRDTAQPERAFALSEHGTGFQARPAHVSSFPYARTIVSALVIAALAAGSPAMAFTLSDSVTTGTPTTVLVTDGDTVTVATDTNIVAMVSEAATDADVVQLSLASAVALGEGSSLQATTLYAGETGADRAHIKRWPYAHF